MKSYRIKDGGQLLIEDVMNLELTGKRAIVTGGSRGLGFAVARQLAEEGVDVVIAGRHSDTLMAAATDLAAYSGRRIVPIVAEAASDASVSALVAGAVEQLGGVDILINNAASPGAGSAPSIKDVDTGGMLRDYDIKIGGYIRAARAVAPIMANQGWGRIINIGGLAARRAGNYTAAARNAAVSSITKNLCDEYGPRGVGVLAIHPGFLRTPTAGEKQEARARQSTILGRLIEFSEIAWLVAMLVSPRCVAMNGETLKAAGGTPGTIEY